MSVHIAGYVLLLAVWSIVRIRGLLGRQQNIEAAVYGSIMAVTAVIGSLLIARVNLPSFMSPVIAILEPIGKMLLKQ